MRPLRFRLLAVIACCLCALSSCKPSEPETPPEPEDRALKDKYGITYIYEGGGIPEVHVCVPIDQWNSLLKAYDANAHTKTSVKCDVRFVKDGETTEITEAGIRLKGNTSRRRPEGSAGRMHSTSGKTDWHHCHYQINFKKFVDDDAHKLHGAGKIALKWFKDDAAYVRELYCYDLFRRAGVWTAINDVYCRLYIKIEGDASETYLGVYELMEPIDKTYLKVRGGEDKFGGSGGNLWKCSSGANLNTVNADFGPDLDTDDEYVYELKTNTKSFDAATEQLKDFITKLNSLKGDVFRLWFSDICDVELLLRTYAVNVAVGMWDDYWNNGNNYYLYFSSTDPQSYKVWFIPYDYDNTLGTTLNCGVQDDAVRHDPYNWGLKNNRLISRLLEYKDYRDIYTRALLELADGSKGLLSASHSMSRIKVWQSSISSFVANDTGEDCVIADRPAPWGNHGEYRLLSGGANNYFNAKIESITQYCK